MKRRKIAIVGTALAGLFLAWTSLGLTQPLPAAGDAKKGEGVYDSLCWTCHGRYGRGDGPAVQYLIVTPPDFTDPTVLAGQSDQFIVDQIVGKEQGSADAHLPMVMGEVLKETTLRDAIAYIRTLAISDQHASIKAGLDIYNTFCSSCHGEKGDGQGPAAKNLSVTKPRDFTSKDFVVSGREEELFRTIFLGAAKSYHGSAYMPQWKTTLSQQQIHDIIAYIRTFSQTAK